MAPLAESNTLAPAKAIENPPTKETPAQQTTQSGYKHQDYRPKQTRYNQRIYGESKMKRPKEERPKLLPKKEKTPDKPFRKIEKCFLMPMGIDSKVSERQVRQYHPSPHQPTYAQRMPRPIRDRPVRTYHVRQYRLTENNYGYSFVYAAETKKSPVPERETTEHSDQRQHSHQAPKSAPLNGVPVLPPILGAVPKPGPQTQPKEKTKTSTETKHFPMPQRFGDNGLYTVRDYHYTPRKSRYNQCPRYREYRSPKPLPHREYSHYLVYVGGRPPGQRIQKRQCDRAPVKREAPLQTAKAAPAPVAAVVVPPVAKPPPTEEEKPEPKEQSPAQEEPQKEPEAESEEPPQTPVVAAAAAVTGPSQDAVQREATPEALTADPADTEREPSPAPAAPAVAAAAVTRAATPPRQATPVKSPTPAPSPQPVTAGAPLTAAAAGVATGAAVSAATTTAAAPAAAPAPQAADPKPQAPVVAAAAVAVAASAPAQAAGAPPPKGEAAPSETAPPKAAPPAADASSNMGALGCIQRSLEIFG